jgi:hypothetical protein
MSWFSKPAAVEVEPEPDSPAVDPNIERLRQVEMELPYKTEARNLIRKELSDLRRHVADPRVTILPIGLFVSVNALSMDCPHAALESAQRKADCEVDCLLWERGQLLHKLGRIR